ncbi:MAG: hypothetical protein WCI06_09775, partial [Methylococcaceae bacterium]
MDFSFSFSFSFAFDFDFDFDFALFLDFRFKITNICHLSLLSFILENFKPKTNRTVFAKSAKNCDFPGWRVVGNA